MRTEILKTFTEYNDNNLKNYIQQVCNTVSKSAERRDIPYSVTVFDDDEVNAFATPGGFIYITIGLLKKIDRESELSAVIGHEIAHIDKKHLLKRITLEDKAVKTVLNTVGNKALNEEAIKLIARVGVNLLFLPFAHSNEYEADKFGTLYSQSSGYNAFGMIGLLETIKKMEGKSSKFNIYLTHPQTNSRITEVEKLCNDKNFKNDSSRDFGERYKTKVRI